MTGELERRIGEIVAQIAELEQRRAEPAAGPVGEANAASDALPAVSDADLATLTLQLKICDQTQVPSGHRAAAAA